MLSRRDFRRKRKLKQKAQRRKICLIALAVLLLIALAVGCSETKQDGATLDVNTAGVLNTAGVRTEAVRTGDITYTTQAAGTLIPLRLTPLSFYRVNGPLIGIYVQPGERLEKGQLVAELDPEELQLRLTANALQKNIWELRDEIREMQMVTVDHNVQLSKMALEQAEKNYAAGGGGENEYKLKQADIQYQQSQINQEIARLNGQISDIEQQIFDQNSAALREQTSGSKLYAKNSGYVVSVEPINPGEEIASGKQIARVAEDQAMVLELRTAGAPYLLNQKEITLTIGEVAYAGQIYTPRPGDDIWKAGANSNGGDSVYVAFSGVAPPLVLYEIQPVTITVSKSQTLMVSKNCIRNVNGLTMVDLILNDAVQSVPVVCGLESGAEIEIVSGLKEGDIVSAE